MRPIENATDRHERIQREREERAAKRGTPIKRKAPMRTGKRAQSYNAWQKAYKQHRVGTECDHKDCKVVFLSPSEIQPLRHLVRRTHAPDLKMDTANVKAVCFQHLGQPEDYNPDGTHTNFEQRVWAIYLQYGEDAAMYVRREMKARGKR